MLIDWFTVGAQTLNFLVLVWLMKRYLYKPVLDAIDAREKRIADQLASAETKKSEAEKEHQTYIQKNAEFESKYDAMLAKATQEAAAEKQRLFEEVRSSAEQLRVKRQESLQRERETLGDEISRRTQEEVFSIARKTLTDLSGVELESQICAAFVHQLENIGDDKKTDFAKSLVGDNSVVVRTAFELSDKDKSTLREALNRSLSSNAQLEFQTSHRLIGGIEMISNGRKIAWSIDGYLGSLERSVSELLSDSKKPGEAVVSVTDQDSTKATGQEVSSSKENAEANASK